MCQCEVLKAMPALYVHTVGRTGMLEGSGSRGSAVSPPILLRGVTGNTSP
jgi:hypothetical protein